MHVFGHEWQTELAEEARVDRKEESFVLNILNYLSLFQSLIMRLLN